MGDVDAMLQQALLQAGYSERSYFAAPGGFVLVTRLEQIDPDGKPKDVPARWSAQQALSFGHFSLIDYVRALFTAAPGYYRIIAFVVTPTPFTSSDKTVTEAEATAWLGQGANILPQKIARSPYLPGTACTALIYEFQRAPDTTASEHKASLMLPSNLDGRTHLVQSGLWSALGAQ
jgi:hypothetical protein